MIMKNRILYSLGSTLLLAQICFGAPFQFEKTGSLTTARYDHTATLLQNGKVLVAGGYLNGLPITSSELYDPATGIWIPTYNLHAPRMEHTATLLPKGKVLVVGGRAGQLYRTDAELYDPARGTW